MAQRMGPVPTHCYTNPSFCLQSELSSHDADLLRDSPEPSPSPPPPPPPPQYQSEENLPPPPPVSHQQVMPRNQALYGETNPAFQIQPENANHLYEAGEQGHRYCYVDETAPQTNHRRYASVPVQEQRVVYNNRSRYEYIQDEEGAQLQRSASTRYDVSDQRIVPKNRPVMLRVIPQNNNARYAAVPPVQDFEEQGYWQNDGRNTPAKKQINTPRGRYASLQQEEPPALPDRNGQDLPVAPRNNLATQKLHEILTTPRKPRSRSAERSPRRQYAVAPTGTPQRRAFTPNGSPTRTPNGRPFSPLSLQSSTPTKESSARRCLPLSEISTRQENGSINYGKLRYLDLHSGEMVSSLDNGEAQMRFARMDNADAMSLVTTSPRYQIAPANQQRNGYLNVENAFIAKTAVVPPLSPPSSEANITLMSGTEKMERKNAPLLLMLVGALTCGLALYLSWTQGRRYYFDSAIGCGACCSMAGACQSMRRTWTGLSLAGLSALSCAGLLLLAAKEPRVGTPLHDVTAGALCGVSLLGAALALLTLAAPRCKISRHRRVHSWIPHFSP